MNIYWSQLLRKIAKIQSLLTVQVNEKTFLVNDLLRKFLCLLMFHNDVIIASPKSENLHGTGSGRSIT